MTQWDFENKGILTSPAPLPFVLKVPLRHLRPIVIYSVPCDRILQRAYCLYMNGSWSRDAAEKVDVTKVLFSDFLKTVKTRTTRW